MWRRRCRSIGLYIAGIGVLIVLAVILPPWLWWLLFGLALICAGILLFRGR